MGEGRIVVGRVNILIEFKNTIRLPADSLIASADALIVFYKIILPLAACCAKGRTIIVGGDMYR